MLKKFSKLLILLLVILTVFSFTTNFATDAVTTSETETQSTTETSNTLTADIHYGDLYLFGTDVILDKIVYGSVFIIGNTVEITGQIENDLYVIANTLKIDSSVSNGGFIQGKVYALANSINFNGACSYLYSISNTIDTTYESYVMGNAQVITSKAKILSAIGRNLELLCNTASFLENEEAAAIYGNLTYASISDIEIPEGIVIKDIINRGFISTLHNYSFKNIITGIISAIITVIVLYILLNKHNPNFIENLSNKKLSIANLLKMFLIGLLSILVVLTIVILLVASSIGLKLGIILALSFGTLCFISISCLSISIAKTLKPVLKIEKTKIFLLVLSAVSIVLYGLTLIPFAGIILFVIINLISIGLVICILFPRKKLTDEEVAVKAEAKKLAKENKEKKKQEKFEAKVAKKQAKLEKKEAKKEQ